MLRNTAETISAVYDALGVSSTIYAQSILDGKKRSKESKKLRDAGVVTVDILQVLSDRIEYDDDGNVIATYRITDVELDSLLNCLIALSDIVDIPEFPTVNISPKPQIINVGLRGPTGESGNDGTNANITFTSTDGSIDIVETGDSLVKNVDLAADVYEIFKVSVSPEEVIYEQGTLQASIPIILTITKGNRDITSVTILGDPVLDAALQAALDLDAINDESNPNTTLTLTDQSDNLIITFEVTDAISTIQVQTIISFVYPFLWGISDTILSGNSLYVNSTKIIKDQSDNNVEFDGTDKYFYFGYIGTYPNLDVIQDGNDDIVDADFDISTISITASSLNTNWTEDFTFYYSKVKGDIDTQEYKFNF